MSDASTDGTRDETMDEPMTDRTTEPTPDAVADPPTAARRGPSVPTVVWGLIFALIAAGVIAGQNSDVDLNLDVTAPTALLVAGVVLVLWGIAGLGRSRLRR
jgi:hypothetical protein